MKRTVFINLWILVFLLMVVPACFGGGAQEGEKVEKVTLAVTHNWSGGDAHAPYMDWALEEDFPQKYPNIKLVIGKVVGGDIRRKVRADFIAGAPADIAIYPGGAETELFIQAGWLADMTELMDKLKDSYVPEALVGFTYGNRIYGQPLAMNFFALYANREIFKEYGFSFPTVSYKIDEFNAMITKLKEGGLIPITLPGKGHGLGGIFSSYIYNQTTKDFGIRRAAYGIDGAKFTDPGFVKGAEIIDKWRQLGAFDPNIEATDFAATEAIFFMGKSAINFNAIWRLGAIPEGLRNNIEPLIMPEVPGFTEDPRIITSQMECGWIVSADAWEDAKKKGSISTFFEYFAQPEINQAAIDKTDTMIPVIKGISLKNASYAVRRTSQLLQSAVTRPFNNYYFSPDQIAKTTESTWNLIVGRKTIIENLQLVEDVVKNKMKYDYH